MATVSAADQPALRRHPVKREQRKLHELFSVRHFAACRSLAQGNVAHGYAPFPATPCGALRA